MKSTFLASRGRLKSIKTAQIKINGATSNESILRFYDGGSESWMIRQTNSDNVLSLRLSKNSLVIFDRSIFSN